MAKRVRLSDIADRLKITKVTVSKALRDHPDISRDTRALVKKTAEEMGYSPNLLARSLSSRKTRTIGVVVPKIAHSFFSSIIDAIQSHATEEGYGVILAVSNERADLERQHIERLLAMRVDGLLVSVSQQPAEREIYRMVRTMDVPLVFFDRRLEGEPFSSVTVDDFEGARKAVAQLLQMGYRNIAHIAGSADTAIGSARRSGYVEALRESGVAVEEDWIVEGGFDEQHGYAACKRFLALGKLPEVIFAVSFPAALGARAALREAGAEVSGRIELISFGAGGFDEFYMYPHYCIQQPTRDMGREAVRLLLDEISAQEEGVELEPRHLTLETRLMMPGDRIGATRPLPTPQPTGSAWSRAES